MRYRTLETLGFRVEFAALLTGVAVWCHSLLTDCDVSGGLRRAPYLEIADAPVAMHHPDNQGDWVQAQRRKFNQPIDLDTLLWVRNRMMRLEVEARWADRIRLFEEFFPNDAMIPRL